MIRQCWISVNKRGDYLGSETMETLVGFILGICTVKVDEILIESRHEHLSSEDGCILT